MESEWRRLNNAMIAVRLDELSLDLHKVLQYRPIPVAVPSKAKAWNSWTAGIAGSRSGHVCSSLVFVVYRVRAASATN